MRVCYHVKRLWKVAAPYWFSEDKIQASLRLTCIILLTGATTGISLGSNILYGRFTNAIIEKDREEFTKLLWYNIAAYAGGRSIFALRDYARQNLALRWRSWMTSYYIHHYFQRKSFYKIQSESVIDNPDQRIVNDISSFTDIALALSWTLLSSIIDTLSFGKMLYAIYPPLLLVLLVYSISGTVISALIGRGLVTLNFLQEKKEADFRFGMISIRENAESIAFYGGEENERQRMLQRVKSAFENMTKLLITSSFMDCFTSLYQHVSVIVPAAIVAPYYISGKINFGVITQSTSAFAHILGAFSLIVYQMKEISAFSAITGRLAELDDFLDSSSNHPSDSLEDEEIRVIHCNKSMNEFGVLDNRQVLFQIDNLTLTTPRTKCVLFRSLSLTIYETDHILLTGPSGSGKTSLLRAIAGLSGARGVEK